MTNQIPKVTADRGVFISANQNAWANGSPQQIQQPPAPAPIPQPAPNPIPAPPIEPGPPPGTVPEPLPQPTVI
jgi:hypothetical protein